MKSWRKVGALMLAGCAGLPAVSGCSGYAYVDEHSSTTSPTDLPADFNRVVTAMLADLQSPTDSLPPSWNANVTKLGQYAADHCG